MTLTLPTPSTETIDAPAPTTTGPRRVEALEALELLTEVVAEKGPDYRYPKYSNCAYFASNADDAAPRCIVGHVIARLGKGRGDLSGAEDLNDLDPNDNLDVLGIRVNGIIFTEQARFVMQSAQEIQDSTSTIGGEQRRTWGEALAAAQKTYNQVTISK